MHNFYYSDCDSSYMFQLHKVGIPLQFSIGRPPQIQSLMKYMQESQLANHSVHSSSSVMPER